MSVLQEYTTMVHFIRAFINILAGMGIKIAA